MYWIIKVAMMKPLGFLCLCLMLAQCWGCRKQEVDYPSCEWPEVVESPISPEPWKLEVCDCETLESQESISFYFNLGFDTNDTLKVAINGQEVYSRPAETNYSYGRTNDVIEVKLNGDVVIYSGDMFKVTGEAKWDSDDSVLAVECVDVVYGPTNMRFKPAPCFGYYSIDMLKKSVVCSSEPQGGYM